MTESEEPELELEEQFILRLPLQEAEKIREMLLIKPQKCKKTVKIEMDVSGETGKVTVGKSKLNGRLKKLPTIIESYKTNLANNRSNLFKTADISYILDCSEEPAEAGHSKKDCPHGYTRPMKNAKKSRFRKTLVNPEIAEETKLVEKELHHLLRADLEAVSTRFELIDDEKAIDDKIDRQCKIENMLFGHVSSTDSEPDVDVEE